MKLFVMLIMIIIGLISCLFYQRRSQRMLLKRMEKMLDDARNGCLTQEHIDETMISSIENSMRLFLQNSLLSEDHLQAQKDKIQTMISNISHQIITPLSNIMVYSQLLEEDLSDREHQQKACAIKKQAEKLDFLLQSLVKVSRLETGIIKTVPQQCNVAEMMDSVIIQGAQKAEDKNIQLLYKQTEQEIMALCDVKWTKEACYNILDNAIKYTNENGKIEISMINYQMFARIDIKDNGIGIKEEEHSKIFGRFYRCTNAVNEEGVGLGLYLAREIVESQGGYIKVASIEKKGTCFSVFLPKEVNVSKV